MYSIQYDNSKLYFLFSIFKSYDIIQVFPIKAIESIYRTVIVTMTHAVMRYKVIKKTTNLV